MWLNVPPNQLIPTVFKEMSALKILAARASGDDDGPFNSKINHHKLLNIKYHSAGTKFVQHCIHLAKLSLIKCNLLYLIARYSWCWCWCWEQQESEWDFNSLAMIYLHFMIFSVETVECNFRMLCHLCGLSFVNIFEFNVAWMVYIIMTWLSVVYWRD